MNMDEAISTLGFLTAWAFVMWLAGLFDSWLTRLERKYLTYHMRDVK